MNPKTIQTSEYCTVGHPDRTCDFVASYILDKYLEADRRSRVALEVQLKERYGERIMSRICDTSVCDSVRLMGRDLRRL